MFTRKKSIFIFLIVLATVDFSAQRGVAMNCSECIEKYVLTYGIGVKVASTLDLGISFISNISRAIYEDRPEVKGIRKIFSPLS